MVEDRTYYCLSQNYQVCSNFHCFHLSNSCCFGKAAEKVVDILAVGIADKTAAVEKTAVVEKVADRTDILAVAHILEADMVAGQTVEDKNCIAVAA